MSTITYRTVTADDAPAISLVLQALTQAGKRKSPSDVAFVLDRYVHSPANLRTTVAVDEDGTILGFQALTRATPDNIYGVEPGWGVIGTHIHPDAARRGIGKALFACTLARAKEAGLPAIDASIGDDNPEGLAYYGAMGFVEYRRAEGLICKKFALN